MNKEENKAKGSQKKEFFLKRWLKRLFFPQKELKDIYTEEKLETPTRVVIKNFFSRPLAVISLIVFLLIALFVFIAPSFVTLDLGEQDSTLVFISPGYTMMKYPDELVKNGVRDISVGNNFAIGVDNNGKIYAWGKVELTKVVNMANFPEEVKNANIVKVAAGSNYALAIDDKGKIYGWGNNRLHQIDFPQELLDNNENHSFDIVSLKASNQFSAVVTSDNRLILWGNDKLTDISYKADEFDGHVVGVSLGANDTLILTDEGKVCSPNKKPKGAIALNIPESMTSGVTSFATTSTTAAATDAQGNVTVWGAPSVGEDKVPEFKSKVKKLVGGRSHYTALLEDGTVVCWGGTRYKQTAVPEELQQPGADIVDIYAGSYQNYAVDANGKIHTWGLKGFLMGTDNLGRDIFARLANGGKSTMTIGAVAVIISVIIGIIFGGLAGFFGGATDMILSRVAEVVSAIPFLPFCMILSAVLGRLISVELRMYLIMFILGILSWPGMFRLVRSQIFREREREYVLAAQALGLKQNRIIFKHIIPNVMSVCLVSITLSFGTSMLQEAQLSYLGFGVPLPTPTWGNMLNGANKSTVIQDFWWNWVFVGAIFGLACICINLVGDGLRDALDPKVNGR